MPIDPRSIHIYADGSCYKNPGGASGCAAIVVYPDEMQREEEQVVDFGCGESNNNRMELLACICVLKWIRKNLSWRNAARVQIFTDSKYVHDNLYRAREWRRNGWRNRHGEPKENSDLWKKFLSVHPKVGPKVSFEWTAGKKSPVLKRVDKAAKSAAKRGGLGVDYGYKPGTVARSIIKGAATKFKAKGQLAIIRPYRKSAMTTGENKIRFDVLKEETQTYVESCYAYSPPSLAAELHRQHGYRVQFNADPEYPQMLGIIEEVTLPKGP